MHGTSAYAIGLKVEDAAATVARAKALGAEIFEQPRGPGELAIPAIRGVGGGVIYFLDDRTELAPRLGRRVRCDRRATERRRGPRAIDHVAQTMSYEEMLTWVLFYRSIFRTPKIADGRCDRSGRAGAQPGDRKRRQGACGSPQRRGERQNACRQILLRQLRLERAAPGLRTHDIFARPQKH